MTVLFEDESHFVHRPISKRGFTPDKHPVIHIPPITRKRQSVFGTVDLAGRTTLAAAQTANQVSFVAFLQVLQEEYAAYDYLLLVLDGATYHHLPPSLQVFLHDHPIIECVYLPPHCPELNPTEQIWRLVRKRLAGKYLETIDAVIDNVLNYDQTWRPSLCRKYQDMWEKMN